MSVKQNPFNTRDQYETNPQAQRLNRLIETGNELLRARPIKTEQLAAVCGRWLEAWELVKQMATPEMRTTEAFDNVYFKGQYPVSNWSGDLEMELGNADYHEERIRYIHEYLAQFPDGGDDAYVRCKRAEAEALWALGRQVEAEAVFQALVDKLPDKAWAYIGWSDEYYFLLNSPKDYEKAEIILKQALARPNLDDREYVLDRLIGVYQEWGKPDKQPSLTAELAEIRAKKDVQSREATAKLARLLQQHAAHITEPQNHQKPIKLKRNDPCWCGSGKKYKQCHLKSDKNK